jgi:peptidoglycan/xylan/chitin deacetylase (PgdA/CDA1 family)
MNKIPFSLGEKIGVLSLLLALLLFFVTPYLAVLVLVGFLSLCLGALFLPQFGFFLPVISRGKAGVNEIALTFDDGPSPLTTPILLDLLARHSLYATFFVIGEKAAEYPELIKSILDKGHTIGNHSWSHDYFLMLRSPKRIQKDIHKSQELLKQYGVKPVVFRPPVGITGARLGGVLAGKGLVTVNYSCRAFDRGNRNIHNLAEKILNRVKPGAVIMLHDVPPYEKALQEYWKKELDHLFGTLKKRYTVAPLERLIERPVMMVL